MEDKKPHRKQQHQKAVRSLFSLSRECKESALNNNTTTTSDELFCVIFVRFFLHFSFIFPSFFIQKNRCTSWHHQTNKDRTLLCRFQSTSWYFWECVIYHPLCSRLFFVFGCSLSLVLLLLLLYVICVSKVSFPGDPFFSSS